MSFESQALIHQKRPDDEEAFLQTATLVIDRKISRELENNPQKSIEDYKKYRLTCFADALRRGLPPTLELIQTGKLSIPIVEKVANRQYSAADSDHAVTWRIKPLNPDPFATLNFNDELSGLGIEREGRTVTFADPFIIDHALQQGENAQQSEVMGYLTKLQYIADFEKFLESNAALRYIYDLLISPRQESVEIKNGDEVVRLPITTKTLDYINQANVLLKNYKNPDGTFNQKKVTLAVINPGLPLESSLNNVSGEQMSSDPVFINPKLEKIDKLNEVLESLVNISKLFRTPSNEPVKYENLQTFENALAVEILTDPKRIASNVTRLRTPKTSYENIFKVHQFMRSIQSSNPDERNFMEDYAIISAIQNNIEGYTGLFMKLGINPQVGIEYLNLLSHHAIHNLFPLKVKTTAGVISEEELQRNPQYLNPYFHIAKPVYLRQAPKEKDGEKPSPSYIPADVRVLITANKWPSRYKSFKHAEQASFIKSVLNSPVMKEEQFSSDVIQRIFDKLQIHYSVRERCLLVPFKNGLPMMDPLSVSKKVVISEILHQVQSDNEFIRKQLERVVLKSAISQYLHNDIRSKPMANLHSKVDIYIRNVHTATDNEEKQILLKGLMQDLSNTVLRAYYGNEASYKNIDETIEAAYQATQYPVQAFNPAQKDQFKKVVRQLLNQSLGQIYEKFFPRGFIEDRKAAIVQMLQDTLQATGTKDFKY